ncbi:MAG: hypothetical protein WDN31_16770 [Hyphomicrobium sp.]
MPITSNSPEQLKSPAAMKEHRARDAAQAMREHESNRAARLALTARLRAVRLAKEAETANSTTKKAKSQAIKTKRTHR